MSVATSMTRGRDVRAWTSLESHVSYPAPFSMTTVDDATLAASLVVASCEWGSALGSLNNDTTVASGPATWAASAAHWVTPDTMTGRRDGALGETLAKTATTKMPSASTVSPNAMAGLLRTILTTIIRTIPGSKSRTGTLRT